MYEIFGLKHVFSIISKELYGATLNIFRIKVSFVAQPTSEVKI